MYLYHSMMQGQSSLTRVTAANVKKRLAIVLDNTIYSAPEIKERIGGGNAQISGSFSMEEAKDLAIVLKAGALPAPIKMLQNITVGHLSAQTLLRQGRWQALSAPYSL